MAIEQNDWEHIKLLVKDGIMEAFEDHDDKLNNQLKERMTRIECMIADKVNQHGNECPMRSNFKLGKAFILGAAACGGLIGAAVTGGSVELAKKMMEILKA